MEVTSAAQPGLPRYLRVGGMSVSSYKLFLCIGIYLGGLSTAALAEHSGHSAARFGFGAMTCAIAGFAGARVYYLLVHAHAYGHGGSHRALWDSASGGWSLFGSLLSFVPASIAVAALLGVSAAVFLDYAAIGVLVGGFWIRLGCVFNGCCGGRETRSFIGVRLHDVSGVRKRRIPVQLLEMAWWLLGAVLFLSLWPRPFPPGSYALGVLSWYGTGRFFLEPLRENSDIVFGFARIDRLVAAVLALTAASLLVIRTLRS
jgi:prolipoprotein diacylglyceryltransferase